MPRIKSQLVVLDPSFEFNIDFSGLPYKIATDIPEGTIGIAIDVPSPEDFDDDGSMDSFFKFHLEEAEKDAIPYLGITCSILVELEQEVSQQIVGSLKKYKSFLDNLSSPRNKNIKQGKINFQKTSHKEDKLWYIEYVNNITDNIFVISQKYLKKFLLSLRERGNFCKLKFFDYESVHQDRMYGFFNKYYYIWSIRDENNVELFRSEPLLLRMSTNEVSRIKIAAPIDASIRRNKRDGIINEAVWEQILTDMKNVSYEPDIAKSFLLDAQEEALSMNNNLAIIGAAVACEVFTKRFISNQAKKIGNEFYDYVIEEVREISIPKLLDNALKSLAGHSIKEDNKPLWNDLDRLFQVRNKVAHTGECYYMSRNGKMKHAVDSVKVMDFIERVYELFEILESYTNPAKAGLAH
jgi:hypothetical protein